VDSDAIKGIAQTTSTPGAAETSTGFDPSWPTTSASGVRSVPPTAPTPPSRGCAGWRRT
jgi:hypothetical protein